MYQTLIQPSSKMIKKNALAVKHWYYILLHLWHLPEITYHHLFNWVLSHLIGFLISNTWEGQVAVSILEISTVHTDQGIAPLAYFCCKIIAVVLLRSVKENSYEVLKWSPAFKKQHSKISQLTITYMEKRFAKSIARYLDFSCETYLWSLSKEFLFLPFKIFKTQNNIHAGIQFKDGVGSGDWHPSHCLTANRMVLWIRFPMGYLEGPLIFLL